MTYQRLVRGLGIFLFLVMSGLAVGQALALAPAAPLDGAREAGLLQFRAGQHILGFTPQRAYLVGLGYALIEDFVGANQVVPVAVGGDSQANTPGAPPFAGVQYRDLWQGITLNYLPTPTGLTESHYAIAPQAEVAAIRLRYNAKVRVQADGTLRFAHPSQKSYFSQSAPVAWQETAGRRERIEVAFRQYDDHTIGFAVGDYDKQLPLVIDPTYEWHSFYGSASGDDYGHGIAIDAGGNIYVTGISIGTWNGPDGESPLHAHSGGHADIFVLKLTTAGVYQWHSFYGSASAGYYSFFYGFGIALDAIGNVYVTGYSDDTWNGDTGEAPLHAHSGGYDILVLKLTSAGAYQWHSFYGSLNNDEGLAIAVDAEENLYVTGYSTDTWNGDSGEAPLHTHSGGGGIDIYVLKLTSAGAYQWHSYYGFSSAGYGFGIALDTIGNVYVTGYSDVTWNGDNEEAPLHAHTGGYDIFVLKLTSAGAYQWHSFYGSANSDYSRDIAVDAVGNVYVTGYSRATWNGPSEALPLHPHGGDGRNDFFILKLDNLGTFQWHSFYGSVNSDYGYGIALDAVGYVYVTGTSDDTWNGDDETGPLQDHSGYDDIVILKFADVEKHTVTANAAGTGTGSVNGTAGNHAQIDYDYPATTTGSADFPEGSTVTLTASANTGSSATWSGTCAAEGGVEAGNGSALATCTFNDLDEAKAATATFTSTSGPDLTGGWTNFSSRRISSRYYYLAGCLKVSNSGNRNAGAFRVTYYLSADGVTLGQALASSQIRLLRAGGSTYLCFSYLSRNVLSGQRVVAVIDVGNSVAERDETNNWVVKQIP